MLEKLSGDGVDGVVSNPCHPVRPPVRPLLNPQHGIKKQMRPGSNAAPDVGTVRVHLLETLK